MDSLIFSHIIFYILYWHIDAFSIEDLCIFKVLNRLVFVATESYKSYKTSLFCFLMPDLWDTFFKVLLVMAVLVK